MLTPIIQQFGTPNEQETYFTPTEEGQLAVDVFEHNDNIIIRSTIAGVKAEDLDISIENDMITIRGRRHEEDLGRGRNYFFQECYWGSFSRTIILPVHIKGDEAEAIIKNGVLTVAIPIAHKTARVAVQGLDETYE